MEHLKEVLSRVSTISQKLPNKLQNALRNLKSSDSINALDLIGERADSDNITKAEAMLEANYGVEYPKQKFSMLWEMIKDEGWSKLRLQDTLKWFLKNKKFPNWTVADWFDYGIKLYPYSWALEENNKRQGAMSEMEIYEVEANNEKIYLYRYPDGKELPLKKFVPKQNNQSIYKPDITEADRIEVSTILKDAISKIKIGG